MTFKLNSKVALVAAISGLAIIVGAVSFLAKGGEKKARSYYESTKQELGISDHLAEGSVSYSLFGGALTVEKPVLKIAPKLDSEAQVFLRSFLMSARRGMTDQNSSMAPYFSWLMEGASSRSVALDLEGEALELRRKGDNEDGTIEVTLNGVALNKPYLAMVSGELVSASDVADEIRPADELSDIRQRQVNRSRHDWGHNMVNHAPGMGNWLINATGAFGATVDAHLKVDRQSSGEGEIQLTLTHKVNGSKIGEIRRVARFESMPALDEMSTLLVSLLKSTAVASVWPREIGGAVIAASAEAFARKAKVVEYELSYQGYEPLEGMFKESRLSADDAGYKAFCSLAKLEPKGLLMNSRKLDDSECGIARKLIEDGKYTEHYHFQEGKTLFAELMINKGFKVEVD